ncbi:GNAT family N-acetyltransferase [Tateyamaria sp.]|uniref:GNAT family N-acetyltransferase n=1 Tax=Tateyamaria sp. TaxID=1929288 RepID=UPI0039B8BDAF
MHTFDIQREGGNAYGRLFLIHEGSEAEFTFSILSPHSRITDHAGVARCAAQHRRCACLVEQVVSVARAEEWTIVPLCSFVYSQRAKHPE